MITGAFAAAEAPASIGEKTMPIIQVNLIEGRSDAQKEKLIAALTDGAVQALDAPRESVRVLIYELPASHWGVAGKAKGKAAGGDSK